MNSKKSHSTLFVVIIVLAGLLVASLSYKLGMDSNNDLTQEWDDWGKTNSPKEDKKPDVITTSPKSYKEALSMAKKTGKPIFLFFHADWCNWCKKMKEKTFADPAVKKALSSYIVYHADGDKEKPLFSKYGLKGIPAYFIVDSKEKIKKTGSGYKDAKSFIKWLGRKPLRPRR